MIDAKKLSEEAAKLYCQLDNYETWDKRDIVSILTAFMQLELDRKQRNSSASSKKA